MDKRAKQNGNLRVLFGVLVIVFTYVGAGRFASAQAPPTELSFEVATVKPVLRDASYHFNPDHYGPKVNSAGASYWDMTIRDLLGYAYGVKPFQVIGPNWITVDRFDIEAKFPEEVDKSFDRVLLQDLLKSRFSLTFHIEKKELEGYALVVSKDGPKLKPSTNDTISPESKGVTAADKKEYGSQTAKFDKESSSMHFEQSRMTMRDLAQRLGSCIDGDHHDVVDETGIEGHYQVAYNCPILRRQSQAVLGDAGTLPPAPQGTYSLVQSLESLGLKLERRKTLRDVYVIDRIEMPSEN